MTTREEQLELDIKAMRRHLRKMANWWWIMASLWIALSTITIALRLTSPPCP